MPVEIAAGFTLTGFVELAHLFGLAMGKSIALRAAFVVLPFRLLSDRPKIHDIRHAAPSKVVGYILCALPLIARP